MGLTNLSKIQVSLERVIVLNYVLFVVVTETWAVRGLVYVIFEQPSYFILYRYTFLIWYFSRHLADLNEILWNKCGADLCQIVNAKWSLQSGSL